MICRIKNKKYVAPENDAWRHENNNSEDETIRLSEMHEKMLRYWFVKDGKRKRTPKVSPKVVAPKVVIKGKVKRGSHMKEPAKKKSPPRLVDETVIPPADVIQEGVDLMKVKLEDFLKKNEEAKVENVAESSAKNVEAESVKEKEAGGVSHTDSSVAESDTEPEIDTSKIGVGKIRFKVKPQKKKKDSDEEDSTYIPTPQEKKKKVIKKHKAVQTCVIPRNVRARKRSATMPEVQSGKAPEVESIQTPEVQAQSIPEIEVESVKAPEVQTIEGPEAEKKKPESPEYVRIEKKVDDDDDDEVQFMGERESTPPPPPENPTIHIDDDEKKVEGPSSPKKDTSSDSFDVFPKVHGEFSDDLLPGGDYDMFHDGRSKFSQRKLEVLRRES
ncbi:hypothetical protein Hdeb2414_s0002g00061661 [Helianthus debilis subsp. tardiflorus]